MRYRFPGRLLDPRCCCMRPKARQRKSVPPCNKPGGELLAAVRHAGVAVLLLGLGGCCGSWAGPEIEGLLRNVGCQVLALAAMPFNFEGQERMARAEHVYGLLEAAAHQVICIDSQRLIRGAPRGASMQESFGMEADAIATWLGDFEVQNQGVVYPACWIVRC